MKNGLFILGLIVLGISAKAQQLTFNSQYMLNQYLINPAAAGYQDDLPIALNFRQQWAGFNDAPHTQMLSGHTMVGDHVGVGGILYNDVTGPLSTHGFSGTYAYHLDLNETSKLSFGVSALLTQHVLDQSQFVLYDGYDQVLDGSTQKSFVPDASFGTFYHGDNYYVGIAIPQLLQMELKLGDDIEVNKQVRHYYLSGGYKFELGTDFELEPSTLVKFVPNVPIQYDVNLKLDYKKFAWAGFSWRNQESIVSLLGLKREQFLVGYAYDWTLSNIKNYSSGTHELYLQFTIKTTKQSSARAN